MYYLGMDEQLIKSVEDLGLSQKEARVYLANLSLGSATVQQIADQSGIKRVTTYVILESLANLGLVSQTSQGKKTYFNAEDPISLRRLVEKKEQDLKEQKQSFEEVLPQLRTIKSLPRVAPSVKYYDSREGIKSVMASFLSAHSNEGPIMGMSNLDQLFAFFPEFEATSGNPSRTKLGIKSRFIYTSKKGPILKGTDKQRRRESRYLPYDKYPLSGDLTVVGNHIIMLSLTGSKPIGITIDSQELAKGMSQVFELAWKAAEQYSK